MPFTKTVKEVKRGPCGEPVEAIVKEDECEEIERLKECKFCKPLVTRPTSSVSCVFALNGRGDVLLHHIYQPRHCREKYVGRFFEWWKESTEDKTPVMRLEDVNYFWIQREAILMVGYTPRNVSSSLVLELLFALVRLFGDFIGEFSECALLRNQELVYEILTEVAEDGIPQSTDPAYLKPYIEDLPVEAPVDLPEEQELTALQAITNTAVSYTGWVGSTALSYTPLPQLAEATGIDKLLAPKTKHPHAVQPKKKALLDKRIGITHKNSQMFLDVVEEVSASWDVDTAGEMHNLKEEVLGNIFLKNYIPGVPSVEIALNNNLHVEGLDTSIPKGDAVRLKQCGFHSSVHTTEWAAFKGLNLKAPEGETKVMSYRCCGNIRHPFKLFSYVQQVSAYSYEVVLKLRSELHEGTEGKVIVQCKMLPQSAAATFRYGTVKLSSTHESQECEFSPSSCMLRWTCSVGPSTEYVVRVKVNTMTALIPPLHLTSAQLSYEVISYTSSHLAIQYVRLAKDRSFYRPEQYLRYTTKSIMRLDGTSPVMRLAHKPEVCTMNDECGDLCRGVSVMLPSPVLSSPARLGSPMLHRKISGFRMKGVPKINENIRSKFEDRACEDEEAIEGVCLKPWARAMMRDRDYGGGNIEVISSTVVLSENIVLKVVKKMEAALMKELNKILGSRVPTMITTIPVNEVFEEAPAWAEVAMLYHKTKGEVGKDLLVRLMREWKEEKCPQKLEELVDVVRNVVTAARDLYAAGVVHQDLWSGNLVVTTDGLVSFLDVGDCAEATPSSFLASLGGLFVSIEGILLGVLLNNDDSTSFSLKDLWQAFPHPWWVHTHWVPPYMLNDAEKINDVKVVMEKLLGEVTQDVIKVGMIAHLERFIGGTHPLTRSLQMAHLTGKQRFMSVKRAAVESEMMEKGDVEQCIRGVRGKGFWTLLRQEVGKSVAGEIQSGVVRRVTPPQMMGCGQGPSYLPPAQYPHPYGVINLHPTYDPLPPAVDSRSADAVASLLTLEQMTLCGELPDHVISTLEKWCSFYGIAFKGYQSMND